MAHSTTRQKLILIMGGLAIFLVIGGYVMQHIFPSPPLKVAILDGDRDRKSVV